MKEQDKVQTIVEHTRTLHNDFNEILKPYRIDLWRYCKYLTRSAWDGEDLFQDTLIKAFASLSQRWSTINPKAFLFRIATNTWIDNTRKSKVFLEDLFDYQGIVSDEKEESKFLIREALEILIQHLPPNQVAIFLLMDVFNFKATEVAGMINISENGIYSSIHRSRKKLKEIKKLEDKGESQPRNVENIDPIIDKYLNAFNDGNVEGILNLMSSQIFNDASPGFQEYNKDEVKNGSLRFGLPGHYGKRIWLWGKEVNIVLARKDKGYELHDINYQEIYEDKIVVHKSYFFCRELLTEASKVLNIPIQLDKPPLDWYEIE
ncbi:sigma-70 family RNA polymerase sigma factor [Oceanobacillus profundus]|uniref:Sigma-70 family RNA polymerase sigma factor n=1 Tax=Oceanobacillus profundus TaxID=372463 RepID=A0A417YHT8_9BACI|nr:sigma-70 family RNA polymerase sigma factor [Oceanobacillus profundus]MBR3121451.1 sigma-70 family RNA polymerase sigma factor [Oceanobacillus sp.]PAE28251.1 hypothetical protein CHI07_15830 [Paenibacillus sp. 7884-2]MCM3399711.1 sigma-70 family RNA polymerase sigma factor [Oceanobacillus profundus]MDO6450038.1 sigma-70 family RNA polymerase sigma factor [Oceanobacillus profundus]RHW32523.1 sigma-70 family RNA polymerase sigma factor [Oceanobacillus profundus]